MSGQSRVLRTPWRLAGFEEIEGAEKGRCCHACEAVVKLARRFCELNGEAFFQKNVARIEPLVHIHDRDARVRITRQDRRLDRGSSPVARQKRGVEIQAG